MALPRNRVTHNPPRPSSAHALPTRDAEGRPLLRLQTLGAATILVGESRLSASAGTQFALLLRVASAPGMLVNRDVLLGSLWPHQPVARQRANLRQSLYKLRSHDVRIEIQGDIVQLDASQVVRTFSTDRTLEHFERDFTHGVEPFGVFLPGFEVPWPELQEWVVEHRELVHAEVRRVLVTQLKKRRERADWGGADVLARWLLQFDPLNEEATLTIAECTALTGSKTEALAIIDRYLEELGPDAGDLRLQANTVRRRISDMGSRTRALVSPTERYFVGREREMAELTMSMRRARWHDGSAVLVHGPAGIGKSRLGRELEKVAALEGFTVVHAACRSGEQNRPMALFLDLLPQIIELPGALGCSPASLRSLKRFIPREHWESILTPDRPESVATESGESERPEPSEPRHVDQSLDLVGTTTSSLRRAIIDIVTAISDEKPLLLLLEDVHWIDDQSWDALVELIEHVSATRTFLLLSSRNSHAAAELPERIPTRLIPVRLTPLSTDKSIELSYEIGADLLSELSSDVSTWIARASEGIPLFLHALVVHWAETGEAGGVPPTLQGVIIQRLSRLDRTALRVLQTATLLERFSSPDRIRAALELRTNEMLAALQQLEAHGMIAIRESNTVTAHDLIATSCIEQLASIGLRTLHARIGELLLSEAKASGDGDELLSALEHLEKSRDPLRLTSATVECLDLLSNLPVPDHGLAAIRRIASQSLSSTSTAAITRATARLHLSAGEYRKAFFEPLAQFRLPHISAITSDLSAENAVMLADAAIRVDPLADRSEITGLLISIGRRSELSRSIRLRAIESALTILSNDADAVGASEAFHAYEFTEAELEKDHAVRSIALLYHTIFGDRDIALRLAREFVESARNAGPSVQSYTDAMRSGFAFRVLASDRSHIETLELAFDIANRAQMPKHALNVAVHLGHTALDRGNITDIRRWNHTVSKLHGEAKGNLSMNYTDALLCRVAIQMKDLKLATAHYDQVQRDRPKNPSKKHIAFVSTLQVGIAMLSNRSQLDKTLVDRNLERLQPVRAIGTCDYMMSVALTALLEVGETERAKISMEHYLNHERREARPISVELVDALSRIEQ